MGGLWSGVHVQGSSKSGLKRWVFFGQVVIDTEIERFQQKRGLKGKVQGF